MTSRPATFTTARPGSPPTPGRTGHTRSGPSETRPGGGPGWLAGLCALAVALGPASGPASAQEHRHADEAGAHAAGEGHAGPEGGDHHGGLHFSHPLLTESVSPDTKIRVDHQFVDFDDGFTENAGFLEGEYAFHRSFSVEVGLPYSYTEGAAGNFSANFKFANYAFESAGLLLGYGVELTAPTAGSPDFELGEDEEGHDDDHEHVEGTGGAHAAVRGRPAPHTSAARGEAVAPARFHTGGGGGVHAMLGSDEWEIAPYVNLGWKGGDLELVGWAIFGVPFSQAEQEEVATELSYDLSALYHVSTRFQALVELNGSGGISGPAVGEDVAALSPGIKLRPAAGQPVWIGLAGSLPLWGEDPFEARALASLLWHF